MGLKQVGSTVIKETHRLRCHCEAVVLELNLPDGLVEPGRCNCSYCRRRGAIMANIDEDGLRIVQGGDVLRRYQFHTKVAEHFFCSICGIYTHHRRRSNPHRFGFNVACLEGVNPLEIQEIEMFNGIDHPSDRITSASVKP